ncbi:MAG: NAD(P)H-dependent oxidoreductase [Lactobacillus sp.]|jgi:modulator of drug activity B|nr:NAD(P)H-dependent oxidoreductase [Lactobacillus sp.]MCI2032948.1 NAD(P)H-dependent oxidoreductase [Lactobacillus sp.]
MKILLLDGYTPHPEAQGKLTHALVATSQKALQRRHDVQTSTVHAYDAATEAQKWQWADLIILHFPVYWYAVPWGLKRYLDEVLAKQVFYTTDQAGRIQGMMTGKHFAYVTSLAATQQALEGGPGITNLLAPLSASLAFCGLTPSPQIANHIFYDVYGTRPSLAQWLTTLSPLL